MKIKTTAQPITKAPKGYVRLVLDTKGSTRFVEKSGTTELHIVSGAYKDVTPRTFRTLVRTIAQVAKKHEIAKLAVQFSLTPFPQLKKRGDTWVVRTIAENLHLADYTYTAYKSTKEKKPTLEVLLCGDLSKAEAAALKTGEIVAESVNTTRNIANTPGGDMTPALLAKAAKNALRGTKVKVRALDLSQIKKLGMGGLVGVGQGAKDKPRFIILEYFGGKKSDAPIVFVGKGITFDTGGLQVKPGMAMYEMHMDMSGGAAVIGALRAAAKLGLKKNLVGLIPAAENAISDEAIRPGDVLTMMSGKTVDVLHTDAEGRLVLADGLHYAKKYKPGLIVDVATLTGAALVAVGQHAHVIMTKDRKLEDTLRDLGETCGDYVHPLPLWDEFVPYTKGVHGDISNIPSNDSKYGGTINAATFLSHFTEGERWVHIDMAPRMTAVASDKLAKGATGEPVRLLLAIAENL
ncbi:leucyl aminopeptidase family protein [Candidatus Kaiserbacteria bacterium]|nr:leucyl aminopeptidase family protein [Candidatus Kaiserbacteria bacterium]